MEFSVPTFDTLRLAFVAVWRAIRGTDADTAPGSDIDVESRGAAHLADGLHAHMLQVVKWLFAHTSSDPYLWWWLWLIGQDNGQGGYGRILATGSTGTDALQVTCSAGTPTVTPSHTLKDTAGNTYAPTETYAFPGAGTYDFDVEATDWNPNDQGAQTNLEAGETLTFDSPPAGIQTTATLVADLDGGVNDQTETEGREAVVAYFRYAAFGGNWPEWQRELEAALPGQVDAYVWYARNNYPYGWGCVDATVLQRGETAASRVATSAQGTVLAAYAAENLPTQMVRAFRFLTITPTYKTISVTYELAADTESLFYCDWDAESYKYAVTADDYTTKCITVGSAYPAETIVPGDKVFVAGKEAEVVLEPGNASAPVSGNYAKFTVSTWPWEESANWLSTNGPSGAGFTVCSGGGLVSAVFDAVQSYMDGLGPARGVGTPAPIPGWQDRVMIPLIDAAAASAVTAQGAAPIDFTTTIDAAAVDYTPTYDNTSQAELAVYDEIQIYQVAP